MTVRTIVKRLGWMGCAAISAALLAAPASAQQRNCIDTLAGMPDFSRLVGAVTRSHMVDDMRFSQNITIFAPTNAAMDAVNPLVADRIFPRDENGAREADPVLAVAAVNAHIVQGRIPASALGEGLRLVTLAGTPLTIGNTPGAERGVTVTAGPNITARVVQRDIPCSNGVVHTIDRVLVR